MAERRILGRGISKGPETRLSGVVARDPEGRGGPGALAGKSVDMSLITRWDGAGVGKGG